MLQSLEELKKVEEIITPLIEECSVNYWDDVFSESFLHAQRIGMFIALKLLKECKFLEEDSTFTFTTIDPEIYVYDYVFEIAEEIEHIVHNIYEKCGWSICKMSLDEVLFDFYTDYVGLSDDEVKDAHQLYLNAEDVRTIAQKEFIPYLKEDIRYQGLKSYLDVVEELFPNIVTVENNLFTITIFRHQEVGMFLMEKDLHRPTELSNYIEKLIEKVSDAMLLYVPDLIKQELDTTEKSYSFNTMFFYLPEYDGEEVNGCAYKVYSIVYAVLLHSALSLYEMEKQEEVYAKAVS